MHRFCKMKTKILASHCLCMHHIIFSLSLFRCHCFGIIITTTSVGLIQPEYIGGEIRTSSRLFWLIQVLVFLTRSRFFGALDLFLTSSRYFWWVQFVFLTSSRFIWWVRFVFFDKLQICLVGSICFLDKLQIFLVGSICVFLTNSRFFW